jgi:hypothetical protein
VPVGGGGLEATERLRARVARGRPNWWVILAVSLALMALLVATAGAPPGRPRPPSTLGESAAGNAHLVAPPGPTGSTPDAGSHTPSSTTTTTATTATTTTPPGPSDTVGSTALVSAHGSGHDTSPTTTPAVATTTTVPTTTTTTTTATAQPALLPADRMQTQGYLDPPVQTSNVYGFTGTGATEVSVVWSGDTYLTMTVSCANGSQSVGGTSAMEASLPDAQGSCEATVVEPASESVSLTYSITIGPGVG